MATEPESPALLTLHSQIRTLTDLHSRIQSLRQIPIRLLRPPSPSQLPLHDPTSSLPASSSLGLQDLKNITETIKSQVVQDALRAAKESQNTRGIVASSGRREGRKRRCACFPFNLSFHSE